MVPYVTLRLRLFPHLRWGFANYSIKALIRIRDFRRILTLFKMNSQRQQCFPAQFHIRRISLRCGCLLPRMSKREQKFSPAGVIIQKFCIRFSSLEISFLTLHTQKRPYRRFCIPDSVAAISLLFLQLLHQFPNLILEPCIFFFFFF